MKNFITTLVSVILFLGIGISSSFAAESIANDLQKYRGVDATLTDSVSNTILTPSNNTDKPIYNGGSLSPSTNFFKKTMGNIKEVGGTNSTMKMLSNGTMFTTDQWLDPMSLNLAPYQPIPILPLNNYTTNVTTPLLIAYYKDPDIVRGGKINFKITSDVAGNTIIATGASTKLTNGAYGYFKPLPLSGGTYYWFAQSQDTFGFKSSWVSGGQLTVDGATPVVTVNPFSHLINTTGMSMSGTRSSTSITVSVSLIRSGSAIVNYAGLNWTATITGLSEGDNPLMVQGAAASGTIITALTDYVKVDTTPPAGASVSITPSSTYSGTDFIITSTPVVSFSATDVNPLYYSYSTDNGSTWSAYSAFVNSASVNFGAAQGNKKILVKYRDEALNETSPVTDSAVLDTVINAPAVVSPNNGYDYTTGDGSITIIGTTDFDAKEVRVNGSIIPYSIGTGVFTLSATLQNGVNNFSIAYTDKAGNVSTATIFKVTFNSTAGNTTSGNDATLELKNIEANRIQFDRINTDPNIPSEIIKNEFNFDSSKSSQ